MERNWSISRLAPLCLGALTLLTTLGSCSKEDDTTPEPEFLQLTTDTLIFTGSATQQSFQLESTGKSWAIEISEAGKAWLTVTPPTGKSGTTTIAVKPGEYADDFTRYAYLLVGKAGETPKRIGISQSGGSHAANRQQDSLSLTAIYHATGGANWEGSGRMNSFPWEINTPITEWSGVTTELIGGEQRVTALTLARVSGMNGKLPKEIGYLSELKELTLAADGLTGALPKQLALLTKLTTLQVSSMQSTAATWDLTEEYKAWSNLESLHISNIEIPRANLNLIYKLPKITTLYLGLAHIGSAMEVGISNLTNLEDLTLRMANITALPSDMGELSKLKKLTLSTQRVTALPSNLSKWSTLEELIISNIRNTVVLPDGFKNLTNLIHLDLSTLGLAFNANDHFTNMSKLKNIYLSYNRVTGPIAWLAGKPELEMMQIDQNNGLLTGEIPAEIYNYPNLSYFVITPETTTKNNITGNLNNIHQLTKLSVFGVVNAELSGSLKMPNSPLLHFDVSENNLVGGVDEVLFAETISTLRINGNRLSGLITEQVRNHLWDYSIGDPPVWGSLMNAITFCPQQGGYGFSNCWSYSVN